MSKWQLMETDLMTTGITIGKHPMAFLREELTKHGVIAAYQTTHLKKAGRRHRRRCRHRPPAAEHG
ncbi:MAG: hypothetical protein IPG67_14910 [Acidobacteria bacterium]|nr:hypothetical protein [Acidobacteriota bacterium]